MAIRVHGAVFSTATMRVCACLNEKGLDYEFVLVNMRAGEHKKDPFLSIHNPKEMASALVWMEVEAQKYGLPATKLTWELSFKPMMGKPIDDAVVEEYVSQLSKVLDVYEALLA